MDNLGVQLAFQLQAALPVLVDQDEFVAFTDQTLCNKLSDLTAATYKDSHVSVFSCLDRDPAWTDTDALSKRVERVAGSTIRGRTSEMSASFRAEVFLFGCSG
jgi:hypothetical protein